MKMKNLLLVATLGFLFLSLTIPLQEKDEEQALSLKMYVTTYSHDFVFNDGELQKGILMNTKDKHFYLMVTNHSDENVIIWEEMNTWGFKNFFFEILDEDDNVVYTIKKNDNVKWTENNAEPLVIQADETYVREVNFTQRHWVLPVQDDLPQGSYVHYPEVYRKNKEYMTVKMRAVLEIKDEHEDIDNWVGRIQSKAQKVNLVYPWKPKVQHPTE